MINWRKNSWPNLREKKTAHLFSYSCVKTNEIESQNCVISVLLDTQWKHMKKSKITAIPSAVHLLDETWAWVISQNFHLVASTFFRFQSVQYKPAKEASNLFVVMYSLPMPFFSFSPSLARSQWAKKIHMRLVCN